MIQPLHDNEIPIDRNLVRRLIDSQLPQHSHLPLQTLSASGSSNLLFRLGSDMLIRLPRQPGGSRGLRIEQHWASQLRSQLPVDIPEVLVVCEPSTAYPESWSVVRWLDGNTVGTARSKRLTPEQRTALAADLADSVRTLQSIEITPQAAVAPELKHYRGNTLHSFDPAMRSNIDACRQLSGLDLNLNRALEIWEQALTLPGADETDQAHWYHSDLVAENLLSRAGRLRAILDFGGLGVGDPSIDLHGVWELFNASDRQIFRERLGVDDAQWMRGRAWAIAIALGCFPYYWKKMPERISDRLVMANEALTDDLD